MSDINFQLDISKQERQLECVEKWRNAKGIGTLLLPTGFGKTYTGFLIAETYLERTKDIDAHVHILTPSVEIAKQWAKQIKPQYAEQMTVYGAGHVLNGNGEEVIIKTGLLIVDEIDAFYSDERFKIVDGTLIEYKYILGLTATWEDIHGRHEKMDSVCPVIDTITEKEAISKQWISQFLEFNLGIKLDEVRQIEYTELSEEIANLMSKFGRGGLDIAKNCLTGGFDKNDKYREGIVWCTAWATKNGWRKNLDLSQSSDRIIDDNWNPQKVMGYAKQVMLQIRLRKTFIYSANEKLKPAVKIIEKFDDLKTICFSQSTMFATRLCDAINEMTEKDVCTLYHSAIESRPLKGEDGEYILYKSGAKKGEPKIFGAASLKKFAVNAITNGDVRVISTASSLDKGFDVKSIRLGIITSGTQNYTQQKQRGGRVKRVESFEEDIIVLIINIYLKNTKDEDWLRKRQSKSSNKVFWIKDIEEISYKPKDNFYEFEINEKV